MSNYDSVLPPYLQVPHMLAFDLIAKSRFDDLELDAALVYMIDTVNESALYYLAEQFDVLGFKGWRLADTVEKQRSLIKRAIELHRFKGTIWAIKEALRTIGYPDATITEHVQHWAGFTIQLNAGNIPITVAMMEEVVEMVKEYKNVRSHLMGIEFEVTFGDEITITDSSYEAPGDNYNDGISVGGDFRYNGAEQYDGTRNYSSDTDVLELTIT